MKTALVIVKRPIIILPPLAKLCCESYAENCFDWTCVIDLGEISFHHKIKSDFLVRRNDLQPKLAIDLAKAEGKCDRVILVNFGDRCDYGYKDKIKTNCVGLSNLINCEGDLLEDKAFIQGDSFVCYSCTEFSTIGLDRDLNVFISQIATPLDLEHYNTYSR